MVFGGALIEESAEYDVGDRYNRGAQEGEGAEPGDSAATADESTTVLLMSDLMISLRDVFASATAGDRITFVYTVRKTDLPMRRE